MNKFTRRIAWTGKIWIAMLCAFLGSIAGTGSAESDLISSFDHVAEPRVIEQFFGLVETEEGMLWPKFLLAAYHTGQWQTNPPPLAFHVPASQAENTGVLSLQVDRASAGEDLILGLTYDDDKGKGSLYIGLSYWPEGSEANEKESAIFPPQADPPVADLGDLFGNIMQGQGEAVTEFFEMPIQSFNARYLNVDIYRGEGEITIFGVVLYTRSEFYYWLEQALVHGGAGRPAIALAPAGLETQESAVASANKTSADSARADLAGGGRAAPEMSAAGAPGLAPSAEQIAAAVQLAANYMITRSVLSGGGTRQTSPSFIMEDSFAQSSAIGFSFGSLITLHAGYQQADDQSLAITNVSVIPSRFNPFLGDVATLSYVLSTRPRGISLEVYDPVTLATFTLTNNMPQGPGLRTFVWDGKDTNGNLLAPADWIFRILARDYQGRVLTNEDGQVTIRPEATMPVILAVDDNPDPFCPTNDGAIAISYTTVESQNRDLDVTVGIEDAAGNSVANFSTNNQAPGSYALNWDGANARSGLYVYRINAKRSQGVQSANERIGSIILGCGQDCTSSADGNVRVCYQPGAFSLSILPASPGQLSSASYALLAQPGLLFQGGVYDIQATPSTNFYPPAILTFRYDSAITGDIDAKLQIRRYDESVTNWVVVAPQFIDYASHRIIAEVTNLSLYAVFAGEEPAIPAVLPAAVRIEPETLNVNPGILTAFVSLPAGYPASGITSATCDGALYERMMLNEDETEMIIKFRRRDIEAALAQIGESIDIYFVVRGTWQDETGNSYVFQGTDSITKIVGAR